MTMERVEARQMAKSLAAKGTPYAEISDALKDKGVLSIRTGKPLTPGGVFALLKSGRRKQKKKAPSRAATRRQPQRRATRRGSDRSMLEIVQRLLSNDNMQAGDRIAASAMLIESHLKVRG